MESKLSKIIILLIAILLVGGGIALYYFWSLKPSENITNSGSTGDTPYLQTNTTPSNNQTQSQTTPLDIEKAFTVLFNKLAAQGIKYTSANTSSTGALGGVFALYANDAAASKKLYPTAVDFSVQVSLTDLNADGTPEALVYEDLPGYCGSGGCEFDIYKVANGKWVNIFSTIASKDIGVSGKSTQGYADIFLSVRSYDDSQDKVVRYVWDGTTYQPKETVATWDGTTFNLSQ